MILDAHCHCLRADATHHFVCAPHRALALTENDRIFEGVHPWDFAHGVDLDLLREKLARDPRMGIGEIGLDRLKEKTIPPAMRAIFAEQLALAAKEDRSVVLHGAKCWGEVVAMCRPYKGKIPSFLFHGFSRSGGLLPDIADLNGFISVGPAILNDHAVNYRELVRAMPLSRVLVESDATEENAATIASLSAMIEKLASLRSLAREELLSQLEINAAAFLSREH